MKTPRQIVTASIGTLLILQSSGALALDPVFQADFQSKEAIVSEGGTGKLNSRTGATAAIEVDSAHGGGGLLKITLDGGILDGATGDSGVRFVPTDKSNWLNSWVKGEGINTTMVGALDFFYSQSTGHTARSSFRIDFNAASNTDGYRLMFGFLNNDSQISLQLLRYKSGKQSMVANVSTAADEFRFTAGKLYHIALIAESEETGKTIFKLFVEEGAGAINVATATPLLVSKPAAINPEGDITDSFRLSAEGEGPQLGIQRQGWVGQTGEVAFHRFSIFDAVPAAFNPLQ
jgi:hypothetical protein